MRKKIPGKIREIISGLPGASDTEEVGILIEKTTQWYDEQKRSGCTQHEAYRKVVDALRAELGKPEYAKPDPAEEEKTSEEPQDQPVTVREHRSQDFLKKYGGYISAAIWAICAAVYLVMGFAGGMWKAAWPVFLVGAAVVYAVSSFSGGDFQSFMDLRSGKMTSVICLVTAAVYFMLAGIIHDSVSALPVLVPAAAVIILTLVIRKIKPESEKIK